MEIRTETTLDCLDKLKKLNDLLMVISQSITDKECIPEEIETCVCIAWDLGNSVFNTINSSFEVQQES
ncbi:hypothetical protein ACSFCX_24050 [Yokenella regensburgei]|uniref:hypothetical protein n=1 Tax=Yokenella regensburgei TaxID=158877 RepID=UPI003EDB11A5